ncbi:MAG: tyrosine-type recombinase/integrase [Balneolales bacterium]
MVGNKNPAVYKDLNDNNCFVLQKERGWGYQVRSIGDVSNKALKKAGLPKELKFHCLRHSTATHSLENGCHMYDISKILGHSSMAVTSKFYNHTTGLNYRSALEGL